ncbi:MAG TPA: hypothetical protein VEW08_03705 [Steroidobacteraceae bacterium]|nr:hypothetical protein [Steroidobacteraceae bacterium]
MLLERLDPLDRVLDMHAAALGADFTAYRNHTYRVVNFYAALSPCAGAALEKVALAAAFHDLGIWTAGTFDYLQPSITLACDHLECAGHGDWRDTVAGMIREHHKIRRFQGAAAEFIEPFRRADWIDVSLGVLSFGLPRERLRKILARWPNAGFHKRLAQLTVRRLRTHPLSPIPVLKW